LTRRVNYPDSVEFLYALGNEIKTAKLGLERIGAVLDALGLPQDQLRIVHVAGTNGKGSTCAMIESSLRAQGLRTGLFTSPHLSQPTERIRVGGLPIPAAEFAASFDRVHAIVEELLAAGRIDLHTTYFETVTAMALLYFADTAADVVVLEVGLGGRLDATNVVLPALTVITPVDYDHEQFLGTSIEAIAGEKAGILKAGVPAVFATQRPEAAAVLEGRARELGIPVTLPPAIEDLELHARGSRFRAGGLRIECPLAGEHQAANAATAVAALKALDVPASAIERGIAAARWPGRLERISEQPEIVVDGAHNPAGARALAAYIDRFYAGRRVRLIFGAMRDKAIDEIVGILFPRAYDVIVTAARQGRAIAPEAVRDAAGERNVRTAPGIVEALAMVRGGGPEDAIFVTGSLFLVAEARDTIGVAP
jgi:dihydrofolate synthase/folylpolyglutamate synthase